MDMRSTGRDAQSSIMDPAILLPALGQALTKLDPRAMIRNPVMFVVEVVAALTEFGRCFGMVYQLRDDILDVIDVNNKLGKPAGQDLAEGVYNLPTILALRSAAGDELRTILGTPLDDAQRERARELVMGSGGIEGAIAAAAAFSEQARAALTLVPSPGVQLGLGRFVDSLMTEFPGF